MLRTDVRSLPVSYIKLKYRDDEGRLVENFIAIEAIRLIAFRYNADGTIESCAISGEYYSKVFQYADDKYEIDQLQKIFNELSVEGKVDEETTEQRELLQESGSQTEQTSE